MAIERVATRVVQGGGHHVPEAIIRRRFEAGMRNFNKIYKSLVDAWTLYDNSGEAPDMIEEQAQESVVIEIGGKGKGRDHRFPTTLRVNKS